MNQFKTIIITFLITLVVLSSAFAYYYKTSLDKNVELRSQPETISESDTLVTSSNIVKEEQNNKITIAQYFHIFKTANYSFRKY